MASNTRSNTIMRLRRRCVPYIDVAPIAKDARVAVPHEAPAQCNGADRTTNVTGRRLVHDSAARNRAGIVAPIGNHTFRATGITAYLDNGAR
jgi:hypothetical protein